MNTTQFTSSFWSYYIIAIVVLSFIGLFWLLFSQNKVKQTKKGEDVETMGHAWDGIEEYNNPLPKWWFYLFVLTMLFSIGYLAAYPGLGDYKGFLNWTSANQYEKEVAAANDTYGPVYAKFAGMPIEEVAKDPQAQRIGKNLFDTYCIQCHGSDGKGTRGFPNLTDHDWLWGGTPDKIRETIEKGRTGVMAAWGPVLGEERVRDVANYVMSLSKPADAYDADRAARGAAVFNGAPANCFTCHGDKGQGIQGLGPNLTDDIWLWGGSQKAIIETITSGRHNQMPAWNTFLDSDKLHLMTAYVWGLSNRDGKAAPAAQPAAEKAASAPAAEQASAPADDAARISVENGVVKFYFATGSNDVAAGADKAAAEVVAAAKDGKKVIVSGFADSTGDAAANAELSKQRAQAVQAFLEAQGVPAANIELRKPENTTGAQGNNAEGRRVEVSIEG